MVNRGRFGRLGRPLQTSAKGAEMSKPESSKLIERPYVIAYVRGARRLSDSARTLDDAKARISARFSKRHNRGEQATVFYFGECVFSAIARAEGGQ